MKIEVIRQHINGAKYGNTYDCVCARAITEATGRTVCVGHDSGHFTNPVESFKIDKRGQRFAARCLWLPDFLQWTGSFEISWNPQPRNWTYRQNALPQIPPKLHMHTAQAEK